MQRNNDLRKYFQEAHEFLLALELYLSENKLLLDKDTKDAVGKIRNQVKFNRSVTPYTSSEIKKLDEALKRVPKLQLDQNFEEEIIENGVATGNPIHKTTRIANQKEEKDPVLELGKLLRKNERFLPSQFTDVSKVLTSENKTVLTSENKTFSPPKKSDVEKLMSALGNYIVKRWNEAAKGLGTIDDTHLDSIDRGQPNYNTERFAESKNFFGRLFNGGHSAKDKINAAIKMRRWLRSGKDPGFTETEKDALLSSNLGAIMLPYKKEWPLSLKQKHDDQITNWLHIKAMK